MSEKDELPKAIAAQTDLTFTSPMFDAQEYEKVASAARLRRVMLIGSQFKIAKQCIGKLSDNSQDLNHNFFGSFSDVIFNGDRGLLSGEYTWTVEIKDGNRKALKHTCTYILLYSGLQKTDEQYARLYFGKIGRFTTYPYFRADFAASAASAELQVAPLPSLTERVD